MYLSLNAENIDKMGTILFSYIVFFKEHLWKIFNGNKIYENCQLKKLHKNIIKYNFTK